MNRLESIAGSLPPWQRYACWWLSFGIATVAAALAASLAGRIFTPLPPTVTEFIIPPARGLVMAACLLPAAAGYSKPIRWLLGLASGELAAGIVGSLLLPMDGSFLEQNILHGALLALAIALVLGLSRKKTIAIVILGAAGWLLGHEVIDLLSRLRLPQGSPLPADLLLSVFSSGRMFRAIAAAGAPGLAFGALTGLVLWNRQVTEDEGVPTIALP